MNYQDFLIFKEKALQDKSVINMAENNLYSFFNTFLVDRLERFSAMESPVYRCHLVEDWLALFKLNNELKNQIAASHGVRQSLSILFDFFKNRNWVLPLDVYPFYIEEANKRHLKYRTYQMFSKESDFLDFYPKRLEMNGEVILLTYPFKPFVNKKIDVEKLKMWLYRQSNNILLIDMVYLIDNNIPDWIMDLYKGGQTIILHSLSKMFLIPNHFGVCLLPKLPWANDCREKFKGLEKNNEKLKKAYQTFRGCSKNRVAVIKSLNELKHGFSNHTSLSEIVCNDLSKNPSYLFYTPISPDNFAKDNILVIPEGVFGGTGTGSIVSSLQKEFIKP